MEVTVPGLHWGMDVPLSLSTIPEYGETLKQFIRHIDGHNFDPPTGRKLLLDGQNLTMLNWFLMLFQYIRIFFYCGEQNKARKRGVHFSNVQSME